MGYDKHAFDLFERLEMLDTRGAVSDALAHSLGNFGFQTFVAGRLPLSGEDVNPDIFLQQLPDSFVRHYAESGYFAIDPVIQQCRRSARSFEWREAFGNAPSPKAQDLARDGVDFGMKAGFVIPIYGAGINAWCSMSGEELELTAQSKPTVHLMTMYAFERVRDLGGSSTNPWFNPLSPREREVLCWAAGGKAAAETGDSMGITERTVTAHLSSAMNKLGCSNKTHAVVKAITNHFITP